MNYDKVKKAALRCWQRQHEEQQLVFRELPRHVCDLNCEHTQISVYVHQSAADHYCCGDHCAKQDRKHSATSLRTTVRNVYVCRASGRIHICDKNCDALKTRNADNVYVCSISRLQVQSGVYVASFDDGTAMPISHEARRNILNRNSNSTNRRGMRAFRAATAESMALRRSAPVLVNTPVQRFNYIAQLESGVSSIDLRYPEAYDMVYTLLFSPQRWEYQRTRELEHIAKAKASARQFLRAELERGPVSFESVRDVYAREIKTSMFKTRYLFKPSFEKLICNYCVVLCMFSYCRLIKHDPEHRIKAIPFRGFLVEMLYMLDKGYTQEGIAVFRREKFLPRLLPDTGFVHKQNIGLHSGSFSNYENVIKQVIPDMMRRYKVLPASIGVVDYCLEDAFKMLAENPERHTLDDVLAEFARKTGHYENVFPAEAPGTRKRKFASPENEYAKRCKLAEKLCGIYAPALHRDTERRARLLELAKLTLAS